MAWSTREIAELAGTSLRAVRHYHEVGLLEEPDRRSNGYKQYGVSHLVRVLRIKRLTDLGFSLSQIAAMGEDDHHPEEQLRALDAELAETIERLQRARDELGMILRDSAPTDLPPELAGVLDRQPVSEADRSLVVVMSRVMGPQSLRAYTEMLDDIPEDPTAADFDALPADADDPTRQALADRMAPYLRAVYEAHPSVRDTHTDAPRGKRHMAKTVATAMKELYNPAQRDVLARAQQILSRELEHGS